MGTAKFSGAHLWLRTSSLSDCWYTSICGLISFIVTRISENANLFWCDFALFLWQMFESGGIWTG